MNDHDPSKRWKMMNHELSLRLHLLEHDAKALRLKLVFRNHSNVRLLLAHPEIHDLHFGNLQTKLEATWGCRSLVSSSWGGFVLEPKDAHAVEYAVHPRVPEPEMHGKHFDETDLIRSLLDLPRWTINLSTGEYLVWLEYEITTKYFCPDSHYDFADLKREAAKEQATVWTGNVLSNRLHLVWEGGLNPQSPQSPP
jgi:hypothetical protein